MNLGYGQILALKTMRDTPNLEGSEICKKSDCSFSELFALSELGLIALGTDRIEPNRVHPTLTEQGEIALKDAIDKDIPHDQ